MASKLAAVAITVFSLVTAVAAQQAPAAAIATRPQESPKTSAMANLAAPVNCMQSAVPHVSVLPNGTVVVTHADGTQESHPASKLSLPRRPAGGGGCDKCDSAAPNTPPDLPEVNNWLDAHARNLLSAIESIAGQDGVNSEIQWEQGSDRYGIVAKRTETLRQLALYYKNQ